MSSTTELNKLLKGSIRSCDRLKNLAPHIFEYITSLLKQIKGFLKLEDVQQAYSPRKEFEWFNDVNINKITYSLSLIESLLPGLHDLIYSIEFTMDNLRTTKGRTEGREFLVKIVNLALTCCSVPFQYEKIYSFAWNLSMVGKSLFTSLGKQNQFVDFSVEGANIREKDTVELISNIKVASHTLYKNKKKNLKRVFEEFFASVHEQYKTNDEGFLKHLKELFMVGKELHREISDFEDDLDELQIFLGGESKNSFKNRIQELVFDIVCTSHAVYGFDKIEVGFFKQQLSREQLTFEKLNLLHRSASGKGLGTAAISILGYSMTKDGGMTLYHGCPLYTLREWIDENKNTASKAQKANMVMALFNALSTYHKKSGEAPLESVCPENIRLNKNGSGIVFPQILQKMSSNEVMTSTCFYNPKMMFEINDTFSGDNPFEKTKELELYNQKESEINFDSDFHSKKAVYVFRYMPPELFSQEKLQMHFQKRTIRSNIYSFGVIADELYYGDQALGRHCPEITDFVKLEEKKRSEFLIRKEFADEHERIKRMRENMRPQPIVQSNNNQRRMHNVDPVGDDIDSREKLTSEEKLDIAIGKLIDTACHPNPRKRIIGTKLLKVETASIDVV